KQFGYRVSGIEYVEEAAELTRTNMSLQDIEADVLAEDFFAMEEPSKPYDVIYSGGFIEHFEDIPATVERLGRLTGQWIVTQVPNLYGCNGWISKKTRPSVYAGHIRINRSQLRQWHEQVGFTTCFCNYVGGLQWIMPASHTPFFQQHRRLANCLNLPFWLFNKVSKQLSSWFHICPRTPWLARNVIYIGRKD
ncbi:MAG: class I SAM-dependent methyltransferase, partial [Bacteroidales bacterium]|nr:class I SAM-dependent methyltransferase [Bacteroidales bacterium]